MKIVFLYNWPHRVHAAWAKSVNAVFIEDRVKRFSVPNLSRFFKSFATLLKIPRDVDLVLCEGGSNLLTGYLWKFFNRGKKLAVIVSDPKWHYMHKMGWVKGKLYHLILKKYDLFIASTQMMRSLIPKNLSGEKRVVFVFADTKRFLKVRCDLRKRNIAYAGRKSIEKGADLVVEIFNRLKSEFPESKLYMTGFGELEGVRREEISKDIVFRDIVENPEDYFKECSVYLSPARIDAANISVIETMCMGMIPVVSENVGYKEVVRKVSRELVVRTPEEAVRVIKKLWRSPKLMESYSRMAREVAGHYDERKSVSLFKKAMKELMEGR